MDIDIDFKTFKKIIEEIIRVRELQEKIFMIGHSYSVSSPEEFSLNFPTMENTVIELLEKIFNDESEWISYWAYELDFGSKYKPGAVTFKTGGGEERDIPLKTVEDLWNLLTEIEPKQKNQPN